MSKRHPPCCRQTVSCLCCVRSIYTRSFPIANQCAPVASPSQEARCAYIRFPRSNPERRQVAGHQNSDRRDKIDVTSARIADVEVQLSVNTPLLRELK